VIDLTNVPVHLQVTGGLLGLLVLGFILLFMLPGALHWFRLRTILVGLLAFKGPTPPGDIKKLFARDKRLAHLWGEYQDTLHVQREERDGQMKVIAVRSTAPAESYFSGQYLVDSRLRTEFFKHLPGIFTGLGIIGTFTGLIEGLRQFQVSENAGTRPFGCLYDRLWPLPACRGQQVSGRPTWTSAAPVSDRGSGCDAGRRRARSVLTTYPRHGVMRGNHRLTFAR
jgi:hypothetical protein